MDVGKEGTEAQVNDKAVDNLPTKALQHLANQVATINGENIKSAAEAASAITSSEEFSTALQTLIEPRWLQLMGTDLNYTDITKSILAIKNFQESLNRAVYSITNNLDLIATATQLSELISQIDNSAFAQFYPSNIRQSGKLVGAGKIRDIELQDGIALYYVIRPELINKLIQARSSEQRREILSNSLDNIVEDCRNAIKRSENKDRSGGEKWLIDLLLEAVAVIEEKHLASGESLLAGMLSYLIDSLGKQANLLRKNLTSARKTNELKQYDKSIKKAEFNTLIAIASVPAAMESYYYGKTPMPDTFSRHAIAHHPDKKQFTPANAAQGLLCITSLMAYEFGWENRQN